MMKNFLLKSIALFLSFSITLESIACADIGIEYDQMFDVKLALDENGSINSYNAWIYEQNSQLSESLMDANIESWSEFFSGALSKDVLKRFIYREEITPTNRQKEFADLIKNKSNSSISEENIYEFIDYIQLALRVEKCLLENTPNAWEDEPIKIDYAKFNPLIKQILGKLEEIKNPFLTERYAFQLLKLCRYSKQFELFRTNYNLYFSEKESMISYWAMEHYAGVLKELGREVEANYLFTKVYANCPEKKESSFLSLNISSQKDFDKVLELCVNNEERMALFYIQAMQSKALGLEALKEIKKNLGNHEYARLVMTNEINNLEQVFFVPPGNNDEVVDFQDLSPEIELPIILKMQKSQATEYLAQLIELNKEMLSMDNPGYFWHLSFSYLLFLNGDYDKSIEIIQTIKTNNKDVRKQADMIYVLDLLKRKNFISKADEKIIGEKMFFINENIFPKKEVGQIDENQQEASIGLKEYITFNEYVFSFLSNYYGTSNDFLSLIFSSGTFSGILINTLPPNLDLNKLEKILNDLEVADETLLNQFAASRFFNSFYYGLTSQGNRIKKLSFSDCKQKLIEIKATLYLRNPSTVQLGLQLLESIPISVANEYASFGNPFTFSAKNIDFMRHDEMEKFLPKVTKLNFARKINQLLSQPLTSEAAFQLGLAYYNASYYGLQWKLLAYYREYGNPNEFSDMDVSAIFFKKAIALGTLNKEKQAQAYFMLARCEQNRYTKNNGEFPYNYDNQRDFDLFFREMKNSGNLRYLKYLKTNYKGTMTYNEVVKECKYFSYYLN